MRIVRLGVLEGGPEVLMEGGGDYLRAAWVGMIKGVRVGPGSRSGDFETLPSSAGQYLGKIVRIDHPFEYYT